MIYVKLKTITALRMGIKDDGVSFHLNLVGWRIFVFSRFSVFLCHDGCVVEEDDAPGITTFIERHIGNRKVELLRKITRLTQLRIICSFREMPCPDILCILINLVPAEDRNQILVQLPFAIMIRLVFQQANVV